MPIRHVVTARQELQSTEGLERTTQVYSPTQRSPSPAPATSHQQDRVISTKVSIKYSVDDASGMSAYLYEECLAPADHAVLLELTRISEVSVDVTPHGTTVTLAIARELAAKLGLVPPVKQQE